MPAGSGEASIFTCCTPCAAHCHPTRLYWNSTGRLLDERGRGGRDGLPVQGFEGVSRVFTNPAYLASEDVVDETGCAPGGSVGSLLVSFLRARSSTME